MVALLKRRSAGGQSDEERMRSLFRDLYTRILFLQGAGKPLVLGISSALAGEGTTTIAALLASVLAEDGAMRALGHESGEVLLIECNQGEPKVARVFGVAETPGLVQCLAGECAPDEAIKRTPTAGLAVLPSGGTHQTFPILIRGGMADLLATARARFALTLVDLPPVLSNTDTRVLAGLTDHVMLVVRAASTPARLVSRALEELGPDRVLGITLNDCRPELPTWLDSRL